MYYENAGCDYTEGGNQNVGTILAIKLGPHYDLGQGVAVTGWRVILSVTNIHADVQTTTFYGNSLYQPTGSPWGPGAADIGSLSEVTNFSNFLKPYVGKPRLWAELNQVPYNPSFYIDRTYVLTPPELDPPTSVAPLVLLSSGQDQLRGFYTTFQGNIATIPLFRGVVKVTGGPADYRIKI